LVQSRLDKQIRQLDRLASIGTLSASVAHEIRNALVAGKTFTDLLLEENKGGELVDVVRRETGRIDALVNRMLKFAGTNRDTFSPVHLHEMLDHSLRLVQPQLESRGIILDRSFQASPDIVNGDDYGLEQAFVNLLANAVEAIGEKGTLSVATERTPANPVPDGVLREQAGAAAQLRVTIRDTGVGIPAANMGHMFEPFFTTKPAGTGLGLVITRQIVQEHRGALTVQSQPGQGTIFQITLPEG
jgi:two-component system, NtrC family, sensor histidine kinase HydH